MPTDAQNRPPTYLTTREVAELLRVKERKVYDLAAAGEIPHRRITGKLLFPAAEISEWIEGSGEAVRPARPPVLAGSHDPLLEWAARESGSGLATLFDGSLDGLDCFEAGKASLVGLHLPEAGGWNVETVSGRGFPGSVLIAWATRGRGLIVSEALRGQVASIADLKGRRVAMRQPGAGAAAFLDLVLAEAGMSATDLVSAGGLARTESDAAAAVAAGEAEAAVGIEAMARQFHLPFVPLMPERFDLLVDRRAYFTEPVQRLLAFARSEAFGARAAAMGGYDVSEAGAVRWIAA